MIGRGKPKNIVETEQLTVCIPKHLKTKLGAKLFSTMEQRIPHGAWGAFFTARIQEYFSYARLDLQAYGFPADYFVVGPKEMIQNLESKLKEMRAVKAGEKQSKTPTLPHTMTL